MYDLTNSRQKYFIQKLSSVKHYCLLSINSTVPNYILVKQWLQIFIYSEMLLLQSNSIIF